LGATARLPLLDSACKIVAETISPGVHGGAVSAKGEPLLAIVVGTRFCFVSGLLRVCWSYFAVLSSGFPGRTPGMGRLAGKCGAGHRPVGNPVLTHSQREAGSSPGVPPGSEWQTYVFGM